MKHSYLVLLALLLAGCGGHGDRAPAAAAGSAPVSSTPGGNLSNGGGTGTTVAAAAPGPPKPSVPAGKRIDGGTAQTYRGVSFDIPSTWRAKSQGEYLLLGPTDANAGGTLEELYLLASKADLKTLDGADVEKVIEQAVAQLQPGMTRQGTIEKTTFGDLQGRVWLFTGKASNGRAIEVRVYAFVGQSLCGLLALGYPDVLSKREADVKAILGSMTKTTEVAGTPAALAGKWLYLSQVNANDGGRMTNSWIQLNGDGTFQYYWEVNDSGPNGFATNLQSDKGTWTATDTSLTLKSVTGVQKTYQLEKRNHPKNKQDPMIVLDGRSYVTATPRSPW
jgi:hypothetical protein